MFRNETALPTPLEKLHQIGDARNSLDVWPDYLGLGLNREHIPGLIELAVDRRFFASDEETPEIWATVHAWRALGQLHAAEAVEPLCGLLPMADSAENNDWILEEFPAVFGLIGIAALPALQRNMADAGLGVFARTVASGSIAEIGKNNAEHRLECIEMIRGQLRRYNENSQEMNGFLIGDLRKLKAVEAIETIREAFRHGRVEIAIPGDLEDVEIELGLRKNRETPKPNYRTMLGMDQLQEAVRADKTGRNDPCPCGSGKKYKKCCLPKEEVSRTLQASFATGNEDLLELERLSNSVIGLIESGRYDEAEAVCWRLQRSFPDQADGLERAVLVYKAKGDYARAADYARQAIAFMMDRAEDYEPAAIALMEAELRSLTECLTRGAKTPQDATGTPD